MKKASLILITSTAISLPICCMELEKKQNISPTPKQLSTSTEKSYVPVTGFDILEELARSKNKAKIDHDLLQTIKSSPGAKRCLEIIDAQSTLSIPDWQMLLGYYANDKEGEMGCEGCAELVSHFINKTSKENCTIGLQASIYTNDLDMTITHPQSRAELMKQLIGRQADTGPALQYLAQAITLYGPDYKKSSFITIFNILSDAKAFDQEALTSFKEAQFMLNWVVTKLENNRPK